MQSGAFVNWASKPMAHAQAVYDALVKHLCKGRSDNKHALNCMLDLTASELVQASQWAELPFGDDWNSCAWAPVVDGVEMAEPPFVSLSSGRAWVAGGHPAAPADMDIVIGSNADDGTDFASLDVEMAQSIPLNFTQAGFYAFAESFWGDAAAKAMVKMYEPSAHMPYNSSTPGWNGAGNGWWLSATRVVGDYMMTCPSRRAAKWISGWKAQRNVAGSTYLYNFDYAPSDPRIHQGTTKPGACHACELAFVFNNYLDAPHAPFLHSPEEQLLGKHMARTWAAFASTGRPSSSGWFKWPAFINGTGSDTAVLGVSPRASAGLFKERCDLWDSLPYIPAN